MKETSGQEACWNYCTKELFICYWNIILHHVAALYDSSIRWGEREYSWTARASWVGVVFIQPRKDYQEYLQYFQVQGDQKVLSISNFATALLIYASEQQVNIWRNIIIFATEPNYPDSKWPPFASIQAFRRCGKSSTISHSWFLEIFFHAFRMDAFSDFRFACRLAQAFLSIIPQTGQSSGFRSGEFEG